MFQTFQTWIVFICSGMNVLQGEPVLFFFGLPQKNVCTKVTPSRGRISNKKIYMWHARVSAASCGLFHSSDWLHTLRTELSCALLLGVVFAYVVRALKWWQSLKNACLMYVEERVWRVRIVAVSALPNPACVCDDASLPSVFNFWLWCWLLQFGWGIVEN